MLRGGFIDQAINVNNNEADQQAGNTTSASVASPPQTTVVQSTQAPASPPQQTTQQTTVAPSQSQSNANNTTQVPQTTSATGGRIVRSRQQDGGTNGATSAEDQAFIKTMNEKLGTNAKTVDELKAILNGSATPQQQDEIQELELIDEFLSLERTVTGDDGKPKKVKNSLDDFHRIKTMSELPDIDVVRANHKTAVKKNNPNLTDEQVDQIFNQRYFINSNDVTYPEEFVKHGENLLKADAELLRRQHSMGLSIAKQSIQEKREVQKMNREWHDEVNAWANAEMPKKYSFEFGKVRDIDLGTFEFDVSDQDRNDAIEIIKDPQKLLSLLQDPTSKKIDKNKVAEMLFWVKAGKQALKTAALEYFSEGVDTVSSTLHNEPDLTTSGGTSTAVTSEQQQIQQAEQEHKATGDQVLGGHRGFKKSAKRA